MKKNKQNYFVKIMASLALLAIVLGIIGSGFLVLFGNSQSSDITESVQDISPETLQEVLDNEDITQEEK